MQNNHTAPASWYSKPPIKAEWGEQLQMLVYTWARWVSNAHIVQHTVLTFVVVVVIIIVIVDVVIVIVIGIVVVANVIVIAIAIAIA